MIIYLFLLMLSTVNTHASIQALRLDIVARFASQPDIEKVYVIDDNNDQDWLLEKTSVIDALVNIYLGYRPNQK